MAATRNKTVASNFVSAVFTDSSAVCVCVRVQVYNTKEYQVRKCIRDEELESFFTGERSASLFSRDLLDEFISFHIHLSRLVDAS